jgi:LmbE family N-acetylglucosaminyl deacetylase
LADPGIRDGLFIVMAHPDDEVLWACSLLRQAERIVLLYGGMKNAPKLTAGRRAAMEAFPLPTLDWLDMQETGIFDSASWPNAKETDYGLFPHPMLRLLSEFDPERYRDQFLPLQARLRERLTGARNVVVHSPWGEYGHEDHVQLFRAVAGLAEEMRFRVWVPGYFGPKSEALMRKNLRFFGQPTEWMAIDKPLAEEISQIYKRTGTWTWYDDYVWPDRERFLPYFPQGAPADQVATEGQVQLIAFPAIAETIRRSQRRWKRETIRGVLSWMNGRRTG